MTISVHVTDGEALLRTAFTSLINAEDDLQAVELADRRAPDVVLMDIRMPVMDGIEATRLSTGAKTASAPRVLILTTFDLNKYVFEALRVGASGFTLKSRPLDELLSAIRIVAEGEALLAPSVTRRLIARFSRAGRGPPERTGTSGSSPSASARCSRSLPGACRTPNSLPRCT